MILNNDSELRNIYQHLVLKLNRFFRNDSIFHDSASQSDEVDNFQAFSSFSYLLFQYILSLIVKLKHQA